MQNPIFVFGVQRSGTTLLCTMLSRHPELYITNELPWNTYDYRAGKGTQAALVSYLNSYPKFAGLTEILADPTHYNAWDLLEKALEERMRFQKKTRWGIKDPRLTDYLPLFVERYPKGHFLLIYRDPRATTASQIRRKFFIANAFHGAQWWKKQIEKQLQFAEKYRGQVTVIKFEDLIQEPGFHLRRVCDAINIEYTEAMLDPTVKNEIMIHEHNKNLLRPPTLEVIEKWKKELSTKQVAVIENITDELLEKLGYQIFANSEEVSTLRRCFYDCHQTLMSNYWWTKRAGFKKICSRFVRLLGLSGKKE